MVAGVEMPVESSIHVRMLGVSGSKTVGSARKRNSGFLKIRTQELPVREKLRIAHLWVIGIAERNPKTERKWTARACANLRGNISNAVRVQMMHAKGAERASLIHPKNKIHSGQSVTEWSLNDRRR